MLTRPDFPGQERGDAAVRGSGETADQYPSTDRCLALQFAAPFLLQATRAFATLAFDQLILTHRGFYEPDGADIGPAGP
jgi:hypothetical protein